MERCYWLLLPLRVLLLLQQARLSLLLHAAISLALAAGRLTKPSAPMTVATCCTSGISPLAWSSTVQTSMTAFNRAVPMGGRLANFSLLFSRNGTHIMI